MNRITNNLILFFILPGSFIFAGNKTGKKSPDKKQQAAFTEKMHGSGLYFTQNKGQFIDSKKNQLRDVLFKGSAGGLDVYIRNSGISYVTGLSDRIDLDFVDCRKDAEIQAAGQMDGVSNYFLGFCPKGITGVKSFRELTLKDLYKNTDICIRGGQHGGLEYDFVVRPGGNPGDIRLKYTGASEIQVVNGNLVISSGQGNITECIPKVYQEINGKITDVKAEYKVQKLGSSVYLVTFKLGRFNADLPMVIDPWITYFGGSGNETSSSVTTDSKGNVIYSGSTNSTDFPCSPGAFQSVNKKTNVFSTYAFIVKFTPSGKRVFSTYFGGTSANEVADGITTDNSDSIIVTGSSGSTDFPIQNPNHNAYLQAPSPGVAPAFLAKFTPAGTLFWSTLFGQGSDLANVTSDVATDLNNNIYIICTASAITFPTTAGAYKPVYVGGGSDAFVAKFNNNCVQQWGTYYGGTSDDIGYGITTDSQGNVYICGTTVSTNFPTTPLAHQTALSAGGYYDGFVAKLSGASGYPIWSSYYGGSSYDECDAIAVDQALNTYVTGYTDSPDGISTPGSYQPNYNSGDAFAAMFDNSGNGILVWGTYLGGSNAEFGSGIAFDNKKNNVTVAGDTYSTDFPVTSCASQTSAFPNGSSSQFISTFDTGGHIICSGYFGTERGSATVLANLTNYRGGGSIAIDSCYLYLSAYSACTYPVSANAFQTNCGGGNDAAFSKVYLNSCGDTTSSLELSADQQSLCPGQSVNYTSTYALGACGGTGTIYYSWTFEGGSPAASNLANPTGITYNTTGTYPVKLLIVGPCQDSVIKTSYITVSGITITFSQTEASCNTSNGSVTALPAGGSGNYNYSWSGGPVNQTWSGIPSGIYTVTVTDSKSGCSQTGTVTLNNEGGPTVSQINPVNIACNGASTGSATVIITSGTGTPDYVYSWSNGASTLPTSSTQSTITNLQAGNYAVTIADANGCIAITSVMITQPPVITCTISLPVTGCGATNGIAVVNASGGTGNLLFSWSNGATSMTISNLPAGTYIVTVTDANECAATASATVITHPNPSVTTGTDQTITPGQKVNLYASAGTGTFQFSWSPASSLDNSLIAGPVASPGQTTTYIVTVTDADNCTSTGSVVITVLNCEVSYIFVPDAFSPNGDGKNDVLYVRGPDCISGLKFMVFDRWGELVFETTNLSSGWDGKKDGKDLDMAVFTYYLSASLTNGETLEKKGNVTLLR